MHDWMKSRCRRRHCLREPRARVITMRADVAAEGKARLPFLFLGLGPRTKREKEKMQTHESVWVSDTKCTPSGEKLSTNSAFTFRQGSLTRPERPPDPWHCFTLNVLEVNVLSAAFISKFQPEPRLPSVVERGTRSDCVALCCKSFKKNHF